MWFSCCVVSGHLSVPEAEKERRDTIGYSHPYFRASIRMVIEPKLWSLVCTLSIRVCWDNYR